MYKFLYIYYLFYIIKKINFLLLEFICPMKDIRNIIKAL